MNIKNLFMSLKSKLGFLFKKNKKLFLLALVVLVVLVYFAASPNKNTKSETQNEENNSESQSYFDAKSYENEIESKIQQMLLSLEEIQNASVMVVCDSTEVCEYLKNKTETISGSGDSSSKTITEEVVYEKNGSNSYPVIVSKTMPKVLGVWVVVNSISPSTKLAITKSISSVLNVDETSISILQER